MSENNRAASPPPAQGVRLHWEELPGTIQSRIQEMVGSPVTQAISQSGGFSPGLAARLRLADGRGVFAKAISPAQNPIAPQFHRREGIIVAALPDHAPVPRLLHSYDEGPEGWVVLIFEEVIGYNPATPWVADELTRVLAAITELSQSLTYAAAPDLPVRTAREHFATSICGWNKLLAAPAEFRARLDPWSARHLENLAALETDAPAAVEGTTLLHFDIRADNILLTPDRVWFVDWPHASLGAPWVDSLAFAPSVAMQGGLAPAQLLEQQPQAHGADPRAIDAAIASMAGFFVWQSLQSPPPGLPTLRPFQAAQGVEACRWLAQRTGWA